MAAPSSFRKRLYEHLDLDAWPGRGVSPLNRLILLLIILSIAGAALRTESAMAQWDPLLAVGGFVFATLFTLEYLARLWVEPLNSRFSGRLGGLVYAVRWYALLDLVALSAMWIEALQGEDIAWAAMLRLARILRIFAMTETSTVGIAARALATALHERRGELASALSLAVVVMLSSSIALYHTEAKLQPEAFGSIPRAMYWAVITMTTVGYGDVTPMTPIGKTVASLTALSSIALVALPAGITAAAFSEAFQRARQAIKERGPDA